MLYWPFCSEQFFSKFILRGTPSFRVPALVEIGWLDISWSYSNAYSFVWKKQTKYHTNNIIEPVDRLGSLLRSSSILATVYRTNDVCQIPRPPLVYKDTFTSASGAARVCLDSEFCLQSPLFTESLPWTELIYAVYAFFWCVKVSARYFLEFSQLAYGTLGLFANVIILTIPGKFLESTFIPHKKFSNYSKIISVSFRSLLLC